MEALFRLLRTDERPFELHMALMARKAQHEFFALCALPYERPAEPPHNEFGDDFFKAGITSTALPLKGSGNGWAT